MTVFSAFNQFSPTETKIAVFEQNNHNRSGVSSFGSESRVPSLGGHKFRSRVSFEFCRHISFAKFGFSVFSFQPVRNGLRIR